MTKILIVDDNADIRDVIRLNLASEGYEILEAENGYEGLEVLKSFRPDIVILDVMMPKMNGLEVCKNIRDNLSIEATYIIMLSGKRGTGDRVSALDTGADSYLTKPFESEELKALIRVGLRTVEDRRQAMYDGLTELYNRYSFKKMLHKELISVERYGRALSLVMIDLDHFKHINDTYGHDTGDSALKDFAELLRDASRPCDLPCRWGGEEFVWLLPETGIEGAAAAAERLRMAVEDHRFKDIGSITASFGVSMAVDNDSAGAFCKRADEALYLAKAGGRNRVERVPG